MRSQSLRLGLNVRFKLAVSFIFASFILVAIVPASAQSVKSMPWSGFYLGAAAGYNWGNSTTRVETKTVMIETQPKGEIATIFAGYNYRLRSGFVVGIEGDLSAGSVLEETVQSALEKESTRLKVAGSLRGRFGYAFDRFLPFVAVGGIVASYDRSVTAVPLFEKFNATMYGWNIGAGVEFAVAEHWVSRIEYRYTDFATYTAPQNGVFLPQHISLSTQEMRLGIAYQF